MPEGKRPSSRIAALTIVAATCGWVWLVPRPAWAQSPPPAESTPAVEEPTDPLSRKLDPRRAPRIYFAMWTTHLKNDVLVLDSNWVIGMSGRGYFGATFLNSYGRRAFTAGIQRTIVAGARGPLGAVLGYRLGFLTGYDGRLTPFARKTPVLPLAQPFFAIDVQHVGVEVSCTIVVASVAVSYGF